MIYCAKGNTQQIESTENKNAMEEFYMKKLIAALLAIVMMFSFAACGAENEVEPSKRDYDKNDPEAVLNEIINDFTDITTQLTEKLEETFNEIGTTYDDYLENKELVDEWIELAISESDKLFERTKENSIAYFKLIANDPDSKYSEFCSDAMDDYREAVYEDALDIYYEALYEDAMEDIYEQYYDGIIDDVEDDVDRDEWREERSEAHDVWSEGRTAIHEKWSEERSYISGLRSAVKSAFCYDDNFDVDSIVDQYEKERAEEEAKEYNYFDAVYAINADGEAEVVGFSGEGNTISISSEYEGVNVVRIADSAFENCTRLESITIWADIEEIGDSAFKGCTGLTEFSIPSSVEYIGAHAFEGCANMSVLWIWDSPNIGEYAFSNCTALSEISISSGTEYVGAHAFEGCTGIVTLYIWGVDIIGDYAFAGCSALTSVSIPSDTLSVGNHAFDGCSMLSSVDIWGYDTAIGEGAFANCPSLKDPPEASGTVLTCPREE